MAPRVPTGDSAAAVILGRRAHPKVVAEMLDYSQISVRLDLYSHAAPTTQGQSTAALDALLDA